MNSLRPLGSGPRVVPFEHTKAVGQPKLVLDSDRDAPTLVHVSRLKGTDEVELVKRLHATMTATMGGALETASPAAIQTMLNDRFPSALEALRQDVSRLDRQRLQDAVFNEIVGFGPIQELLQDESISEVMVNGPGRVWIERDGRLCLTDIAFADTEHVIRIIQRIVAPLGRRCDESSPMVDARLPDGSRVNAIIPPLSLVGPVLTIRKFKRVPLAPQDLLRSGSLTSEALQFLQASVRGRCNVIVAGGTGSGKTTLLNTLSSFIPNGERIVSIEDAAELRLQQDHIVTLESRPANAEGAGEVGIRELFKNALRMRPDRIVIGECRGAEALDMLQAMNTGHDGSLTTIHANTARDALARVETMVLMSGADLPLRAIREQIASAIDLVVYIERLQDGARRVTQIAEVRGVEGEIITMQDIYSFKREGILNGKVMGKLEPTGIRPGFDEDLAARGIHLPPAWFGYEEGDQEVARA